MKRVTAPSTELDSWAEGAELPMNKSECTISSLLSLLTSTEC